MAFRSTWRSWRRSIRLFSSWPHLPLGSHHTTPSFCRASRITKPLHFPFESQNRCGRIQLQCIAKQLSALFRFQYGSIRRYNSYLLRIPSFFRLHSNLLLILLRALTDPRWTDEIRRIVDFLFSSLAPGAQAGKPSSVGESSGHPAARLSDFFSSSGQWLPLPPECHVRDFVFYTTPIEWGYGMNGWWPFSTFSWT